MIRFIFGILLMASLGFIVLQLLSFLVGTRSVRRRLKRDMRRLKQQVADIKEALLPFEMKEFKIISAHPVFKKRKRGRAVYQNGFLSTIYQEPVLAFAIKDRADSGQMLLVVESNEDAYTFNYNVNQILVEHAGQPLGIIDDQHRLMDSEGKEIGRLESSDSESYYRVIVHNREIAHINKTQTGQTSESDRLFSLFHDFNAQDEEEFVALSIYGLIIRPRISHLRA